MIFGPAYGRIGTENIFESGHAICSRASLEETTRDLSALAEATVQIAHEYSRGQLRADYGEVVETGIEEKAARRLERLGGPGADEGVVVHADRAPAQGDLGRRRGEREIVARRAAGRGFALAVWPPLALSARARF